MTTYAIGSVLGNYRLLSELLQHIDFNPAQDRLWFAGNLAGGPGSLQTLRMVKSFGKSALSVLGDNELQLMQIAAGFAEADLLPGAKEILDAEDKDELIRWLRRCSLVHHDSTLNFTIVHAGLPAEWTYSQALTFAFEVESGLTGPNYLAFLENRRLDQTRWHAKLRGWKRANFITNACTQIKYCNEQGRLDFQTIGPVGAQTAGLMPWYRVPNRANAQLRILFADDANFLDGSVPGIYPLPSIDGLSARNLDNPQQLISLPRRDFAIQARVGAA
ncbi:symmetrical bis(5'-nucleosyl)-tetraphosphatase [Methylomonas sp. HYX-M1]|uniref:symmetrical bis(5'-nucleosyl)-tetraphosphatase n=1 Tax=Methylomonas sp. HYX-M1 TaxID=3139307 RepID=UPI00345B8A84